MIAAAWFLIGVIAGVGLLIGLAGFVLMVLGIIEITAVGEEDEADEYDDGW